MANTREWTDASKSIGYNFSYIKKPTTEVYSAIKSLGLDTVVWESYYGDEVRDVSRIRSFINKYKPCLFIYDPISLDSGLKKDFIFGVRNPEEVEKWIHLHYSQLKHYSFLMTT